MTMIILLVLAGLIIAGYLLNKADTAKMQRRDAETCIRNNTALYRHYNIRGVQDILKGNIGNQGCIANLDDNQVIEIVQRVRSEYGMGPIAYHNLPGNEEI
jgi:alpha-galactosidase/6-phospho-beta-glucosidase family protein